MNNVYPVKNKWFKAVSIEYNKTEYTTPRDESNKNCIIMT